MKLFEYAIIWHPTEKQTKEGSKSVILVPPKVVLSADQTKVTMTAAMDIPADKKEELDQIEIVIRPF